MNKSFFILFTAILTFPLYGSQLSSPSTNQPVDPAITIDLATLVQTQVVIDLQNWRGYVSTLEPSATKGGKKFKCNLCGTTSKYKGNLKYHIISLHMEDRPFQCSYSNCSKCFKLKTNLKYHESSIHQEEKLFRCDYCGTKFNHNTQLRRHINSVHLKRKPFQCSFCKRKFKQRGNLSVHLKSIHDGIKPFECNWCFKRFTRNHTLKVHQEKYCRRKKKSRATQNQSTLNQFQCSVCNMRFESKDAFASTCTDCLENFLSSLLNTSKSN